VKEWVILCRAGHVSRDGLCVWWKAGGNGYTNDLDAAGRWSEKEARDLAGDRDLAVHERVATQASYPVVSRGSLHVPGEMEIRT
jgi:hypothetical protein